MDCMEQITLFSIERTAQNIQNGQIVLHLTSHNGLMDYMRALCYQQQYLFHKLSLSAMD